MKIIDVHSHTVPQIFTDAMQSGVINDNGDNHNFPVPEWSLEKHLKMMDKNKIQACVLSISAPGIGSAGAETANHFARTINDYHAKIVHQYPARFGAFALLQMPDVDASLREIEYALDVLKLDGVGLSTNYEGVYLGDAKFAPVMDELHRRKSTVFVHPVSPKHSDELTLGYPGPMLEYPFDTTRTVVSLLDTKTLERCDNIRFIFCHGGGTLALLASRIGPMMEISKGSNKLSMMVNMMRTKHAIGSLYFDLAAAAEPSFLAALKEMHDPSKLLMGFDFPYMPERMTAGAISTLDGFESFTEKERTAIHSGNAEKLFPRLAEAIRNA